MIIMEMIKPEEFKKLHEEKKENNISYEALNESSLKNIDEIHKLFPHWKRNSVIKKLKKIDDGKDLRFVARKNGKIIAHVKIKLKKGIHEHIADVTSLIVDSSERRQGIGMGLMKHSISKIPKKITLITLAVDSKNKPAILLYKKIGFEKYGLLKSGSKINGKLIDNYLMAKEIK